MYIFHIIFLSSCHSLNYLPRSFLTMVIIDRMSITLTSNIKSKSQVNFKIMLQDSFKYNTRLYFDSKLNLHLQFNIILNPIPFYTFNVIAFTHLVTRKIFNIVFFLQRLLREGRESLTTSFFTTVDIFRESQGFST